MDIVGKLSGTHAGGEYISSSNICKINKWVKSPEQLSCSDFGMPFSYGFVICVKKNMVYNGEIVWEEAPETSKITEIETETTTGG